MQKAIFTASTDLEIGDKVLLYPITDLIWEVYDIRTIHTLRDGRVKFEFLLRINNHFSAWVDRSLIGYPILREVNKQGVVNNASNH